jgi:hypothetical protein
MRRIATQKAQVCCQEIRVATEVRPTDAPDGAVGSVGNSLRALNPTVGGPMPSRTVLSTSCSSRIASATGIFKAGSVQSDQEDHSRAPPSFSTLNRFAPPIMHVA